MRPHHITILVALALCACNLVDPEANNAPMDPGDDGRLDAGNPPDTGPEDTGRADVDQGSVEVDMGRDAGPCGGEPLNACGGCTSLAATPGDPCAGSFCGQLACAPDNESLMCSCSAADRCLDSPDGVGCICAEGYTADAQGNCVDVDECNGAIPPCSPITTCTNVPGGFSCSPCPSTQYDVYDDGTQCQEKAFDGIEVITAELRPSRPGVACVEARCSGRKVALSGGMVTTTKVVSSLRSDDGQGWTVCVEAGDSVVEANVLCAHAGVEVEAVETMSTIRANLGDCITTQCPNNTRAIGGGGEWGAELDVDLNQTDDDLSAWKICGLAGAADVQVKVQALCIGGPPLRIADNVIPVGGTDNGCIQAQCFPYESLIGGGGSWEIEPTRTMNAPINVTGSTQKSWQVCRDNARGGTWSARAVCFE